MPNIIEENYPKKLSLLKESIEKLNNLAEGTMQGFTVLHQQSLKDGVLSRKTKELMALAMSISAHCKGCIAFHVNDSLNSGASNQEIIETVEVAILMGGGPAVVYGCEALIALAQFNSENKMTSVDAVEVEVGSNE